MVDSWPPNFKPRGRLILAADFVEMSPPFRSREPGGAPGALLLFSDCVVLAKTASCSMTGRELLREVDKPSAAELLIPMTNAAGGPSSYALAFAGWHSLASVRFTESADGSTVWMTSTQDMKGAHAGRAPMARCLVLQEAFEGKAAKWTEDVVKARIEARFPEAEREDPCWTLRSVRIQDSNLGLHVAIFQEEAHELIEGRREPAPIRVVVDHDKGTKGAPVGHYGVEIVVDVSTRNLKRVSMTTAGLGGRQFQDDVALEDFLPTMSRRIMQLLRTQFSVANPQLTAAMVSYYAKTLRGLSLSSRAEKTRSFLPSSPVKLLSSLWGSGSHGDPPDVVVSGPKQPLQRSNSHDSMHGSRDERVPADEERPENPLVRLEQTFTGYIAALQVRKGSIVGRMLLNRSAVDELSVNDVYNRLIESPFDYEAAGDVGTEVVLAAFEKFLGIAWTAQMGPIMTMQAIDTLQERANKRVPGNFADFVNYLFRDMAPHNRRAFAAMIKLMAELLDGCGNDSDRGALTLAFAELLVTDGTAPNYINLLDRLVEDCERIFEEPGLNHGFGFGAAGAATDSVGRHARGLQTASMTSNTSLRRKFGLDTLLRQNPKDERPSVWRSLSRHRNPATGESSSSLSRAAAGRAQSIDDCVTVAKRVHERPGSQDRPALAGAFDEAPQRLVSSHRLDFPLDTIGEPSDERAAGAGKAGKKKRRSSLSDLKSLMAVATMDDDEAPLPLQMKRTSGRVNASTPVASPKTASPSRLPMSPNVAHALRSPRQKENWADPFSSTPLIVGPPLVRPDAPAKQNSPAKAQHPQAHEAPVRRRATQRCSRRRASRRSGRRGRRRPGETRRRCGRRARRGRLQTEKRTAHEVEAALQSDLSKIGDEMVRLAGDASTGASTGDTRQLAAAVKALQEHVPAVMQDLMNRQAATQRDLETTIKTSEAKLRAIDQLHKEAVAENELLYEKLHSELGKIVKAVKGKGKEGKEELVARLNEQVDETARVKVNARLKRDMVSLRAALKDME